MRNFTSIKLQHPKDTMGSRNVKLKMYRIIVMRREKGTMSGSDHSDFASGMIRKIKVWRLI